MQTFATARGIVAILGRLSRPGAQAFRVSGAEAFVRALGGDDALVADMLAQQPQQDSDAEEESEEESGDDDSNDGSVQATEHVPAPETDLLSDAMLNLSIEGQTMKEEFVFFANARRLVSEFANSRLTDTICHSIDRRIANLFTYGASNGTSATQMPDASVQSDTPVSVEHV